MVKVEKAPVVVKERVDKKTADEIKEKLEKGIFITVKC